ncbi:MAG: TylF/MycF/NovP-related O-methyltransferase [Thermodesulfobacteriota bacterium]
MKPLIKQKIQNLCHFFGYEIRRYNKEYYPKDMDIEFKEIYEQCKDYTFTNIEKMYSTYKATEYIVNSRIPGDFVECGVWKGGSSMIIAHTLLRMKDMNRKIYLYDTFEGMTKPTEKDIKITDGFPVIISWERKQRNNCKKWAFAPMRKVKKNMLSTGYPQENIIFVKGKVEITIPNTVPSKIALLRLDTDWYESTYHELEYLFPLLSNKGVLIVDDYGFYAGAKEASDKYFKENNISILLHRISWSRIGVK